MAGGVLTCGGLRNQVTSVQVRSNCEDLTGKVLVRGAGDQDEAKSPANRPADTFVTVASPGPARGSTGGQVAPSGSC